MRNRAESTKPAHTEKARSAGHKAKSFLGGYILFLLFAFCFLLFACSSSEKKNDNSDSPKFQQYYNQGELLYQKNCSNCHQKNGSGLGRLYPPVDTSDYMEKNFEDVICLIRYGKKGEVMVNGITFNQPMPGIPALTDLEIAEIATYIYNSWDHTRGIVDVNEVSSLQKTCNSEYTGSRN